MSLLSWSLDSLLSSFQPSFLFFYFFYFYFGLSSLYIIHTLIQSLQIISPLPPGGLKKKIFFKILGRQVAGESSDPVGCVCVCCVCVGWWSFFTSSVSLRSPSIHSLSLQVHLLFFFPCRSSPVEKGELSLHPFNSLLH